MGSKSKKQDTSNRRALKRKREQQRADRAAAKRAARADRTAADRVRALTEEEGWDQARRRAAAQDFAAKYSLHGRVDESPGDARPVEKASCPARRVKVTRLRDLGRSEWL